MVFDPPDTQDFANRKLTFKMKASVIGFLLERIERFFITWRFPSFMLMTLFLFWVLMIGMAFMPVSDTAWGAFAEDFKIWCFGYDPATGSMEVMYMVMFTVNPIMLSLVIWFVWLDPLKNLVSNLKQVKPYAVVSLLLVTSVAFSFYMMGQKKGTSEFEFKPETLRISQQAPTFTLINHQKEEVSLADFRGKVVVLTSIYTSCADTCPMLMDQAKKMLEGLHPEEKEETVFIAITMDPERDTPERLNRMVRFYNLEAYHYEMLTGEPELVGRVLDEIGMHRQIDKETGAISHVSLFLLIDKNGEVAFRFSLGERQIEWMTEATKMLVSETPSGEVTGIYYE